MQHVPKGKAAKERCRKNYEIIKEQYDRLAPVLVEMQTAIIYDKLGSFNSANREKLYSNE